MIRVIAIGIALTGLVFRSCLKQKLDDIDEERNINYPAAYVVNGEDARISVLKLADNEVMETLPLMGNSLRS